MAVKTRVLTFGVAGALALLSAETAIAADQTILPAAACIPHRPNSYVMFASYGEVVSTNRTEYEWVACGLGQDQALDTNDDIRVYFDDNNGNSSGDNNVFCYAYEVDEDGSSIVYAGGLYGCSTAGGCASDPGIYASENYIKFDDVGHGGAYRAAIFCSLPLDAVGAYSTIRAFFIDEQ